MGMENRQPGLFERLETRVRSGRLREESILPKAGVRRSVKRPFRKEAVGVGVGGHTGPVFCEL